MNANTNTRTMREYGDWLGRYPWDLWATLTFESRKPEEACTLAMFGLIRSIKRNEGCWPYWFVGMEVAGQRHLHALLGNVKVGPRWLRDAWRLHGYAQVVTYDASRGASYYLSKYVGTELCEHDVGGRFWPAERGSNSADPCVEVMMN